MGDLVTALGWTMQSPNPNPQASSPKPLTPPPQVGGMGDVVTALGRAVQEEGHKVEVILPKYDCINYGQVRGWGQDGWAGGGTGGQAPEALHSRGDVGPMHNCVNYDQVCWGRGGTQKVPGWWPGAQMWVPVWPSP